MVGGVFDDGYWYSATTEVISQDLEIKQQINHFVEEVYGTSMAMHNGTVLMCGGKPNKTKCFQLDHGTWKVHSFLNKKRTFASAVETPTATFLFGGELSAGTYEYLPNGSNTWQMGKCEIPNKALGLGCAISVKSGQEIWFIGGAMAERRMLVFNVNDHSFSEVSSKLNIGRDRHRCAVIPGTNKIIITGGRGASKLNALDSTEILDTEDGTVTIASPMNSRRVSHGIGIVTVNDEDRLAIFGGFYSPQKCLDDVELYNSKTNLWESTKIKLNDEKAYFGYLTVRHGDILDL